MNTWIFIAEHIMKWREGEEYLNGFATKDGLRHTACHKAGHAILAWLLDAIIHHKKSLRL